RTLVLHPQHDAVVVALEGDDDRRSRGAELDRAGDQVREELWDELGRVSDRQRTRRQPELELVAGIRGTVAVDATGHDRGQIETLALRGAPAFFQARWLRQRH